MPGTIRPLSNRLTLRTGDHMTRAEFHRIYKKMPDNFKAELIGGTIYVASPLKRSHGTKHVALATVFGVYQGSTPGVEAADNATVFLGRKGEPQPDLFLRILPEFGGQSATTASDFVKGAPELFSEISDTSRALDLRTKRLDYRHYGALEYLVVCLRKRQLRWFDLQANKELELDPDGVCRVHTFPGLWIHAEGLFDEDYTRLLKTLQAGLATREHKAFVRRLHAVKKRLD
jgi:hypothetical protein